MNTKRFLTMLGGIMAGLLYAFLTMYIVQQSHRAVSMSFIFLLPLILGAIPVLFSTNEQLQSYLKILLLPWIIVLTFFYLSFISEFEGLICLVIIIGPFLILGSLGAFIFRLIKLRQNKNQRALYVSLVLPFLFLLVESHITPSNYFHTVKTEIIVNSAKENVWRNIKNVRNIQANEIEPHFVHFIGVPTPLNGDINFAGVGGERKIVWEKGIQFVEKIKTWNEGEGFTYTILVNPRSIPPKTLDEHVLIGGEYFDVLEGSYHLKEINKHHTKITLTCKYRITTTLNNYGRIWANFLLNDFNEMILEVIKNRAEKELTPTTKLKPTQSTDSHADAQL